MTAHIQGNNAYHAVTGGGTNSSAVLDGFVITAGQANGGSFPNDVGGGMFNDTSSLTLRHLIFSGNSAILGGGMYNSESSPKLTNVTFSGNSATDGGGMYNDFHSSPTLTNVTFSGNSATINGGGMYNDAGSAPTLTNVIIWGSTGGSIFNIIIGSNPTISYSLIAEGNCPTGATCGSSSSWNTYCGTNGGGNIAADPQFVDADGVDNVAGTPDDSLRLQLTSPAIDAGNNNAVPTGVTTDLDGKPRFVDIPTVPNTGNGTPPIVDMGAYEAQEIKMFLPLIAR